MNGQKITLLLLSILTIMAAAIVAPALPDISAEFSDYPAIWSKLVLSLPAVFIALSAPFTGRFIDAYGRLRLLFGALVLYALAGTSGLYLESLVVLLMGRAFLGIAIGMVMTITITLIGDYFEGKSRQDFIGLQSAFIGVSGVVFLAAGGLLADISWRMPFVIYFFSIVLIPFVLINLKEPERHAERQVLGNLRFGGTLKVVFLHALVLMILFYVTPTQLPFLLEEFGYESKTLSGMILALNAIGMVLSSMLYSRVKSILSFPKVFALGFFLMAIGYMVTGSVTDQGVIIGAMLLSGFGLGFLMPNTNLWAMELSPPQARGRTMGMLTTSLFLGQFLSPIAVEPIIRNSNLATLFFLVGCAMAVLSLTYLLTSRMLMRSSTASV